MKYAIKIVFLVTTLFGMQTVFAADAVQPESVAAVKAVTEQVNINSADADMLATKLVGVGAVKAKAIVEYRAKNGAFKSIQELANVDGIGEATLDKNKDIITLQ